MKKINKLVISTEKIMKNEELINLQGGYHNCRCFESDGGDIFWWEGSGLCAGVSDCGDCGSQLSTFYGRSIYCIEV